jgi:hypothetical protein
MQREKCVDVTALMDAELMLHLLRSKHHKVHLAKEFHLKDVTDANMATRWDKLRKMKKDATKDD